MTQGACIRVPYQRRRAGRDEPLGPPVFLLDREPSQPSDLIMTPIYPSAASAHRDSRSVTAES